MFPPATTKALAVLSDEHMADGLRYAAAHVSSYFIAAVERISDMENLQSDYDQKSIECEELRAHLAKIEVGKCSWEADREVVLHEKSSLADQVAKLKEEARLLDDREGVLSLENVGLSERTTKLEVDLVPKGIAKGALKKDVSWVLSEGLSRVVD